MKDLDNIQTQEMLATLRANLWVAIWLLADRTDNIGAAMNLWKDYIACGGSNPCPLKLRAAFDLEIARQEELEQSWQRADRIAQMEADAAEDAASDAMREEL